ncbi:glycosyltransferase family 2 protein [Priestia megaterium]|nr:glycosyltransferase family 2 protein [Priestia megaterium]
MKDIHVFLLDYFDAHSIQQALDSLSFIADRVSDVSVIDDVDQSLNITAPSRIEKIHSIKLINNDLGMTLNQCIRSLSGKYVLFLYEQDSFNAAVQNINLALADHQHVMAYCTQIKDKSIQLPFLMKTSFLKEKPFFLTYEIPFREALFPAWLSVISKSSIASTNHPFINKGRHKESANIMQKMDFAQKYQYRSSIQLTSPSLSIMIATYNMAEYIDTAINSCFLQSTLPNKVYVIDDGSADGSYIQLQKWKKHAQFELFQTENGGKARALNKLLPSIETEFVLELDADDWLDPDALGTICQYLNTLPPDAAVLYGNLRRWKQTSTGNIRHKKVVRGTPVHKKHELLAYRFPLGPRIYRASMLKKNNGFPILPFENGRMYEDVSVLNDLLKTSRLIYEDFTVYNVREHKCSTTKKNHPNWSDFIKYLT